jgi:hypothetical protein
MRRLTVLVAVLALVVNLSAIAAAVIGGTSLFARPSRVTRSRIPSCTFRAHRPRLPSARNVQLGVFERVTRYV